MADRTGKPASIDDGLLPSMLRVARRTYGTAIRQAQIAAGCDDVPRNGSYILGGMGRYGIPLTDLIRQLAVSKQSASQLVDALVERGYLERTEDPQDRRRVQLTLTARGRTAANAGRTAVDRVQAELLKRVGTQKFSHTKETLAALIAIGDELPKELPEDSG
jgi:DNA-binding MarR family transcriptional regulator